MLRDYPSQLPVDRWMERLEPKVAQLQAALKNTSPQAIAWRSGAILQKDALHLQMLFQPYRINTNNFAVSGADGKEASPFIQSLILSYLRAADGTSPAARWISFRELPNGGFYHRAFQGYAPNRMTKRWADNVDEFVGACRSLGGASFDLGDAGFTFYVLPRIEIAAVYWLGDEDFPSQASILFDANAHHYMVTDGLAILGSRLVGKILAAGEG